MCEIVYEKRMYNELNTEYEWFEFRIGPLNTYNADNIVSILAGMKDVGNIIKRK